MIKMEALIGNGVTAQKKLVNVGKRKVLTPGGREKNKGKNGRNNSCERKNRPGWNFSLSLTLQIWKEKKAGRWPVRNKCTGKNQISIKVKKYQNGWLLL